MMGFKNSVQSWYIFKCNFVNQGLSQISGKLYLIFFGAFYIVFVHFYWSNLGLLGDQTAGWYMPIIPWATSAPTRLRRLIRAKLNIQHRFVILLPDGSKNNWTHLTDHVQSRTDLVVYLIRAFCIWLHEYWGCRYIADSCCWLNSTIVLKCS